MKELYKGFGLDVLINEESGLLLVRNQQSGTWLEVMALEHCLQIAVCSGSKVRLEAGPGTLPVIDVVPMF